MSRRTFFASFSSATSTVVFGTIVSSADPTVKPAASIDARTVLGGRERELVLVDAVRGHEHDAAPLEEPGDRARRAEVAVVLRERVANLARGAVAVVGQRLDNDSDAARAVALVHDRLERAR